MPRGACLCHAELHSEDSRLTAFVAGETMQRALTSSLPKPSAEKTAALAETSTISTSELQGLNPPDPPDPAGVGARPRSLLLLAKTLLLSEAQNAPLRESKWADDASPAGTDRTVGVAGRGSTQY